MTIIPDGLLMTDTGDFGETCRGQTSFTEIVIEAHDDTVTEPVTAVNTLLADTDVRNNYPLSVMQHPNRLAELMQTKGLSGPDLARAADTTKQQIHKLRIGERKLTREWAERLAPHLDVSWPEVMGWTGSLPAAATDPAPLRHAVGTRISWARIYRQLDLTEAARRFAVSPRRLTAIEAGIAELTVPELATISAKLQVPSDFLLLGSVDDLPHRAALEWKAYLQEMRSERPIRTG